MPMIKVQRALLYLVICTLPVACAPQQQAYMPADSHPVAALKNTALQTSDESALPLKTWLPKGKPSAVIIALHGFNDYSHAFQGTGEFFKAHDVAVVAYDQRGFGKAPHTGMWSNEKNLISDLAECVRQASKRWPHTPVYILGESMGGAVAIAALAEPDFPKVQGVILSAPALWGGGTMNTLYRSTLWFMAHTAPSYTLTGRQLHIMASDNLPMLAALGRDPLVIKETRVDTIYGLVHLMDDAYEKVPDVKTPVLLLYGAHDEVIPRAPVEESRSRFSVPVRYNYYPEGYHMLLRDLEREKVLRDILGWVQCQKAKGDCGN